MSVMPGINTKMKGFQLEMLFEYPNELEGGTYLDWTHWIVKEVIILKTITKFRIKWATEWLCEFDKEFTVAKITKIEWNPTVVLVGAWREYLAMQ